MKWFLHQLLDLLAYWVLPFVCFLLPAPASNWLAKGLTGPNGLFRIQASRALKNAKRVLTVEDDRRWQAEFRLVRFLDAVDVWHGRFSSDRRLQKSLVVQRGEWPEQQQVVVLGTHLGPSTLLLRCLDLAGFRPCFVYRDVPLEVRRQSPVLYAYLRWRIRYLEKVCRGGAIRVPGGSKSVEQAIAAAGDALVLLIDAPAMAGESGSLSLGRHALPISLRGLRMVGEQKATLAPFRMFWDAGEGKRVLEVAAAWRAGNVEASRLRSEAWFQETLLKHPAQWQLWMTAQPVMQPSD